jgi:hypothetical protein
MVIRTLVFLPRELKEQFNRLSNNNVRGEVAQDDSTIVTRLIWKYIRGAIEKEKIKGQSLPTEVSMSVYIQGPHVLSVWEEFNLVCKKESKDPSKVIVDLINLYTMEKLKKGNGHLKEGRKSNSYLRVKALQNGNN